MDMQKVMEENSELISDFVQWVFNDSDGMVNIDWPWVMHLDEDNIDDALWSVGYTLMHKLSDVGIMYKVKSDTLDDCTNFFLVHEVRDFFDCQFRL